MTRLRKILVAIIAREKKMVDKITYFKELHEIHLVEAKKIYEVKLAT